VAGKVVEGNTLAEVHALLVEGLPVEVEPVRACYVRLSASKVRQEPRWDSLHVIFKVYTLVTTSRDSPESVAEFLVVNPNRHIGSSEVVKATGVVCTKRRLAMKGTKARPRRRTEVKVANDDLLDILNEVLKGQSTIEIRAVQRKEARYPYPTHLDVVAGLGNGSVELLLRLVVDLGKDVVHGSSPDFGVVLAATRLPEDETLDGVVDEAAVHGKLSADRLGVGVAEGGSATASQDPSFVGLEVTDILECVIDTRRSQRVGFSCSCK
jgi:hypothetical protein